MHDPIKPENQDEPDLETRLYPFIIGGLIHDSFGTLGALRAHIEGLGSAGDDPAAIDRKRTRLLRGTERLEKVLRLIQSLSRPYYKENTRDLVQPLESLFDMVHMLEEAHPHIDYRCEIDPVFAVGDILPLGVTTFLIGELLTNATRACAQLQEAHIDLTMRVLPDGREIEVVCSDSGPAMDEEVCVAVNEGRARPPDQPHRGGYGLYLMTQIVMRMGGDIKVEQRPETGKRIRLRMRPKEALDESI